jgi:acyl-coenzyme A thioesterase PaaI-like protein
VGGPSPEEYVVPLERTLDGRLGFEVLEADRAHARARGEVTDAVWGIVHGGAHAALAGLLASEAISDGEGRLCAISRVTLAIRPRRFLARA